MLLTATGLAGTRYSLAHEEKCPFLAREAEEVSSFLACDCKAHALQLDVIVLFLLLTSSSFSPLFFQTDAEDIAPVVT